MTVDLRDNRDSRARRSDGEIVAEKQIDLANTLITLVISMKSGKLKLES